MAAADPLISETPPSLEEVREAVKTLKGGKAAGICNISTEKLKVEREKVVHACGAVCHVPV